MRSRTVLKWLAFSLLRFEEMYQMQLSKNVTGQHNKKKKANVIRGRGLGHNFEVTRRGVRANLPFLGGGGSAALYYPTLPYPTLSFKPPIAQPSQESFS